MEIRVLSDYRDQLITERTRLVNRLRWQLVAIAPELEAQLLPAALKGPRIRARLTRQLARLPHSPQLRVAKTILRRTNQISREERELYSQLTALVRAYSPQLLAEPGVGSLTAAVIVDHTAGAERFRSKACFARHAGTAPIPASSQKTIRHRLHRDGDPQLNRAIHIMALSRAKLDPATHTYLRANTPKANPNSTPSAASPTSPPPTTTSDRPHDPATNLRTPRREVPARASSLRCLVSSIHLNRDDRQS